MLLFYLFIYKNYFNFFMFRDVPECSVFLVFSTAFVPCLLVPKTDLNA